MTSTLALHAAACLYMTGVIWIIQVLHYPAFALVPGAQFPGFHARHTRAMSYVVGPVMLAELGTAFALAFDLGGAWWWNLAAVGALFLSTFLVSVPLHNRLAAGRDRAVIGKLTRTNWPRTALWTVRSLVFVIAEVWQ